MNTNTNTLCYMTIGFTDLVSVNVDVAKWSVQALKKINVNGEPSMVVGRPGVDQEVFEDDGRTLIIPVPDTCPKVYAVINELNKVTLMLADEY